MKPRVLYSSTFAFLALSGGRFTAPFLEHEVHFSESYVGLALACQGVAGSLLGACGGALADAQEKKKKQRGEGGGRAGVFAGGILACTVAFLLHGIGHVCSAFVYDAPGVSAQWRLPSWVIVLYHFILRLIYAAGMKTAMPTLDGMTLAYLETQEGKNQGDYGKERLYGALWWAISNVTIGPIIDRWGFASLYGSTIISSIAFFFVLYLFVKDEKLKEEQGNLDQTEVGENNANRRDIQLCLATDDEEEAHTKSSMEKDGTKTSSLVSLLVMMCGTVYGASFLFSFFTLCVGTSVVESLIFLFFEFLGASNTICGLTVVVTVLFEFPIFHLAPQLLRILGAGGLQLVACVAYVTRVFGYSLIPESKSALVLFLEPLHGVTYACAKTGSVEFAARLMPPGYESSGQGLLSLFQGLGTFLGLSLGGWSQEFLGPRVLYRALAVIVSTGMSGFAVVLFLKQSIKLKDSEEKLLTEHDGDDATVNANSSLNKDETLELLLPASANGKHRLPAKDSDREVSRQDYGSTR